MKRNLKLILLLCLLITSACDKDKEIRRLLRGRTNTERIEGAFEAAKSGNKAYVPLLLRNAGDPGASTSLRWKGQTVCGVTMWALDTILHVKPPHKYELFLTDPDSANIKFYISVWQNMNKGK